MKYKIFNLNQLKNVRYIGAGCYGKYYRLSSMRGIKLLTDTGTRSKHRIYSFAWAQSRMKLARQEGAALRKVYKSGLTPKLYKVGIAKLGHRYHPAIIMEHFENYKEAKDYLSMSVESFYDRIPFQMHVKFSDKLRMHKVSYSGDLYDFLNRKLKKITKLKHMDLHYSNILFKERHGVVESVKIIDFGCT